MDVDGRVATVYIYLIHQHVHVICHNVLIIQHKITIYLRADILG